MFVRSRAFMQSFIIRLYSQWAKYGANVCWSVHDMECRIATKQVGFVWTPTKHLVRYIETREKEVWIAQLMYPKATKPIRRNTETWKTNSFWRKRLWNIFLSFMPSTIWTQRQDFLQLSHIQHNYKKKKKSNFSSN